MTINQPNLEIPGDALTTPPSGPFPKPPVRTVAAALPFGQLTWEDFERLCHRLLLRGSGFDHAARYGRQGQAQQGIDLFARLAGGRYEVWQAKRYKTYSRANLRSAVKLFLAGTWADKTDTLVLAVQASLDDALLQDEIETQTMALKKRAVHLRVLGGDGLVEALRPYPELVFDFFGRGWVDAFYGDAVVPALRNRLDGAEFACVRAQLTELYEVRFRGLDQGMATARHGGPETAPQPLPLLERYVLPDVFVQESAELVRRPSTPDLSVPSAEEKILRLGDNGLREQTRRLGVADWLAEGDHFAVIADAGAGKTTFARALALDLLRGQTLFPSYARRFGHCLPLVIPFAKWARETAEAGGEVGLQEMVAKTLQPLLTTNIVSQINRAVDDGRVVLIVDGLDEWSVEQAARTTLNTLLTYAHIHSVPTVVSARPQGLRKIGVLPTTWRSAHLAPLSAIQQRALALIWFRHLTHPAEARKDLIESMAAWEVGRFMKELSSDPSLGDLAQSPLLFVGLMFLAARSIALPRNRVQALQSLTNLLIEVHPNERATAAGDVKTRFELAASPEIRQSALGALAFASRRDGGDAGYPRRHAVRSIREHLTEAEGYDTVRAAAIAAELLAINAETVGLIVEKAPEEVGFVHASLEEILGAVHIQSWQLSNLLAFVSAKAGDPRWRNVLRNLVALSVRASETDEIIGAIESANLDASGDLIRRKLLADIAFSPSKIPPRTAQRLTQAAFDVIDGFGAETERAALMVPCLNAMSDPLLGAEIERRTKRWAPRRLDDSSELYSVFGTWPASDETWAVLILGFGGDDRSAARSAARAIAACFGSDPNRLLDLRRLMHGNVALGVAAAALEALVLGWPEEDLNAEIEAASASGSPLLEATALWARIRRGLPYRAWLERCLTWVSPQSALDVFEQDIASEALFEGWPDDDQIVASALESLGSKVLPDLISRDIAVTYLLKTKPGRSSVKTWMLDELTKEYAFAPRIGRPWSSISQHCLVDSQIKNAVVTYILNSADRFLDYQFSSTIMQVRDPRLKDHAVAQVRREIGNVAYWNLLPLLRGWRDDAEVQQLITEVLAWPDNQLGMVAELLPALYDTPAAARDRLLQITQNAINPRLDMIIKALSAVGSTGDDVEAVEALLPRVLAPESNAGYSDGFYFAFASHPKVLEAAHLRLEEPEAPIARLAQAFPTDVRIRTRALSYAQTMPHVLRSIIVAACGVGADRHPVLRETLATYNEEVDFQLRVQLSIDHYRLRLAERDTAGAVERLCIDLEQPRTITEDRRAAAFAGLVVLGRPEAILTAKRKQPIPIGSFFSGVSAAFCSLIVEHWGELKQALGPDFVETIITSGDGVSTWATLSRYIAANLEARRDFLDWCASNDYIGSTALRSLAEFGPRSEVLKTHALRGLDASRSDWSQESLILVVTAAEILRDQFLTDDLRLEIKIRFEKNRDVYSAMVMAIVDPSNPLLSGRTRTSVQIGREEGLWLAAAQIAARLDPPNEVVDMIHAMAERDACPGREGQALITNVLIDRLGRDATVANALVARLNDSLSPSAFAASLLLLSSAGRLDAEGWILCQQRANETFAASVPIAAFDVQRDQWRPLAHILTDLLLSQTF
ncbi:MAG: NACHT domain-containing protein [Janthinobacterium lividum]